jgi:hypothetical protein
MVPIPLVARPPRQTTFWAQHLSLKVVTMTDIRKVSLEFRPTRPGSSLLDAAGHSPYQSHQAAKRDPSSDLVVSRNPYSKRPRH